MQSFTVLSNAQILSLVFYKYYNSSVIWFFGKRCAAPLHIISCISIMYIMYIMDIIIYFFCTCKSDNHGQSLYFFAELKQIHFYFSSAQKENKPAAAEPEIEDFMAMMDRELSKTHIGQSFEKQSKTDPTQKKVGECKIF